MRPIDLRYLRLRQDGAAIVSALLVVTLAALLVAGLLWRQQIQIRSIENQRLSLQTRWIGRGGTEFARLILRSAADTAPVDYLGGVWAVPIAQTRLSTFLGQLGVAGNDFGDDTFLSGSIEDAQSKFNLRNLVSLSAPGRLQPDAPQLQHFQRLLQLVGVDIHLADAAALAMRASLLNSTMQSERLSVNGPSSLPTGQPIGNGLPFTDQPGLTDQEDAGLRPLPITSVDALLDVRGFTPDAVARLKPFVTVLPLPTPVNVNTAPAEVIAAMVPGMDLSAAQTLVAERDRIFFVNLSDFVNRVQAFSVPNYSPTDKDLSVKTSFFVLHGRVQHNRADLDQDTLIYRSLLTHTTQVISVRTAAY